MTDMLQEYCDSRGVSMRVDRSAGVIRGVKVLGLESRNGRSYLPEALAQAASLYEDAKVNVNHPKGNPSAPRDYQDRIGTIHNVAARPAEGLFGDFHFNPKHALAEQLMWDAEHAAENVGFSHNVEAKVARRGDRVVVEAITRVQSVDLVADPATTRGLFESAVTADATQPSATGSASATPSHITGLASATPSHTTGLASATPLHTTGLASATPSRATGSASATQPLTCDDLRRDYPELVEDIRREQTAEIGRLQQEVDRLTALEATHEKRGIARRLLREFELPDVDAFEPWAKTIVSKPFVELLMAAPDLPAMRALVEERSRLVRTLVGDELPRSPVRVRPQSRDQHLASAVSTLDDKSFVEAIT